MCSISRTNRCGFTLIEVMTGLAILSIMILIVARIFSDTSKAFNIGVGQAESSSSGRAVMDYIVRDLSMAVADDRLFFRLKSSIDLDLRDGSDRLYFTSLRLEPELGHDEVQRVASKVIYNVSRMSDVNGNDLTNRFRLMRFEQKKQKLAGETNPLYSTNDWTRADQLPGGSAVVAENVTAFNVFAYKQVGELDHPEFFSGKNTNALPLWLDIYLEMLSDRDAVTAAELPAGSVREEFINKHAKGYVSRVHFHNRAGYTRGR